MSSSIVVVTWNCAEVFARLVESLNAYLDPERTELVVVDNASRDESAAVASAWRGRTQTLVLERNLGFGAACNIGVRAARGDAVVLLNPDTRVLDAGLEALAETALRLDALVGPRIVADDGSVQPSASGPPVGGWPWLRALVPQGALPTRAVARTEPWRLDASVEVAWLTGACVAAPRARLLELGPFDESLELYGEDLDLGLRAARHGVRSVFAPEVCRIVHLGDVSSSQRFADGGVGLSVRNGHRVLEAHFGPRRARSALRAERLRLQLRIAAKRLLRRPTTRDSAWARAIRAELRG